MIIKIFDRTLIGFGHLLDGLVLVMTLGYVNLGLTHKLSLRYARKESKRRRVVLAKDEYDF